jgi:tetratricopeptide (TPR) repeat protein
MNPELLNNSVFLKYYNRWQENPRSIVFVPVAEYFMRYGMLGDALNVLRAGLKHHPDLISANIVMARLQMKTGDLAGAKETTTKILSIMPENAIAQRLFETIDAFSEGNVGDLESPYSETADAEPGPDLSDVVSIVEVARAPREVEEETQSLEEAMEDAERVPSWETVTMANIYSAQGHYEKARDIYLAVLKREPDNEGAKRGLEFISRGNP